MVGFWFIIIHCVINYKSFRGLKKRFHLVGLVQIHHIIPRQHMNHPVIQNLNFQIDDYPNLMLLPASENVLNTERLVHDGGHKKYNAYVFNKLENISDLTSLNDLCQDLRYQIRVGDDALPWR